jgi:hypothetical protein
MSVESSFDLTWRSYITLTLILFSLTSSWISLCTIDSSETNKSEQDLPFLNSELDLLLTAHSHRESYIYHNYTSFIEELKELNKVYPNLVELYTAQEEFGLPDSHGGYKIWYVRLTNESLGFNKPEVLFVGGHHGNEPISIEVPFYLIECLVENYQSNESIHYLLDHREVYIMPLLNPWGWENNSRYEFNNEDSNRDYPYGSLPENTPLTTIGARAVTELMNEHAFILSLSWHSGNRVIYYAWGTPIHETITAESPDDTAFMEVAKSMTEYAGGDIDYPYGPANKMFSYGGVFGAWSDYAYAAAWDTKNTTTDHEAKGARSLALGIEISNSKKPDESKLGNSQEVFVTSGEVTGLISQNIRMGLVLIELAEPYLTWVNPNYNSRSNQVKAGSEINLSWHVNGSFSVTQTRILSGTDPDVINNYESATDDQSGSNHLTSGLFSEGIRLPDVPGDYYFVAHAIVDQEALTQNDPEPALLPQSFYVKQRTDDNWSTTINGNTIVGKKDWYSEIIHVEVVSGNENKIWISDYDDQGFCNEHFTINWNIITDGILNQTKVFFGQNPDPINQSEHTSETVIQNGNSGRFSTNIILPKQPGIYYFVAYFNIIQNSSKTSPYTNEFWSQIIGLEVVPRIPYKLNVNLPTIEYVNEYQQTLSLKGIICNNSNIAEVGLDDSLMEVHQIKIFRFDPEKNSYLTDCECDRQVYDLQWSETEQYWYLPTENVSNWPESYYQFVSVFKHVYGEGQSNNSIDLNISNWLFVNHIVVVNKPLVSINANGTSNLNIRAITAWCSKEQIDYLNPGEVEKQVFIIKEQNSENTILIGYLTWSSSTRTWEALNVDITNLEKGKYFVICEFSITDIGSGFSSHEPGDNTEFEVARSPESRNDKTDDKSKINSNYFILIGIVIIFVIMTMLFIILIIRARNK